MYEDIENYYNNYDEDNRLFEDNCNIVEYITTMHYFTKMLPKGASILDACAGTGNYAFKLAEDGFVVTAADIVPHNVEIIKQKQGNNPILKSIYEGSNSDLSMHENESFDVVLCMGAMYHIRDEFEKNKTILECLRVLKQNGILAISYINNNAASLASLSENLDNIDQVIGSFKAKSKEIFIYTTPSEIEEMLSQHNVNIILNVGVDGISYNIKNKINSANKDDFHNWIKLHLTTCEDKCILGYSLHGLIFVRKK